MSEQVTARIAPFAVAVELLVAVLGISRISAEAIIAETGGDMARFPSPAHPASWAGVGAGQP